jgi:hypothetical protein
VVWASGLKPTIWNKPNTTISPKRAQIIIITFL